MKCKKCKSEFWINELKPSNSFKEGDGFYCVFCGTFIKE